MAIGEIITCLNAQDLYNKAEDLSRRGVQTEFIARYTLKVVRVANPKAAETKKLKVEASGLHIA